MNSSLPAVAPAEDANKDSPDTLEGTTNSDSNGVTQDTSIPLVVHAPVSEEETSTSAPKPVEENLAPILTSILSPIPVLDNIPITTEEGTPASSPTPLEDIQEPTNGLVEETMAEKVSEPSLVNAEPLTNHKEAINSEDITLEENNATLEISEEKTPTKTNTEEVITSSQKKKRKKRAAQEKKDEEKRRQALHDVAVKTPLKDDEGMDRDTTDKSNPVKVAPIFRSQMQTPGKPRTTTRTSKIALKK